MDDGLFKCWSFNKGAPHLSSPHLQQISCYRGKKCHRCSFCLPFVTLLGKLLQKPTDVESSWVDLRVSQRPGMKAAPQVRDEEGCVGLCFSLCCPSGSRELRGRGLSYPLTGMASERTYLTPSLFHYSSCWTDLMELVRKVSSVLMCWMGRCYRLEIELVTPEWFSLTAFDLPLILILVLRDTRKDLPQVNSLRHQHLP